MYQVSVPGTLMTELCPEPLATAGSCVRTLSSLVNGPVGEFDIA